MYIRPCEWEDKPCGMWVGATQARVKAHFEVHHGVVSSIKPNADEQRQKCRWKGCECGKPMLSRNLVRHIINVAHFGMKYKCSKCPTEVVRLDDFMEHKMRCPDAEPVLATNAPRVPKKPVFANKRMRTI
ncbi:hypothetical protein SERLA73DRAFT_178495 [Serpula lacrymans var. lacrymans S7.3]|uniref:C2H2-type domain-containing protein n=2 Tax=Serpula lacrymans var. lacrymans TaxID=341189 RepID=F8PRR5_SERL3|nr:uncharacterized protein SERLADRAFT_462972 [Serpula lacrymans var. lacrymans S7.9]EGO00635.1 hypothetical protein SERLA73DRAFT_178495 [Serpula lacrymans var. lacrymans S7.3]EGO26190.1 hypothetical protein SERLADRAFT_462972 [Serpula lacrymans var. lacrymans S7.9]